MSDLVGEVNDNNFVAEVATGVTLVDFWAPWCGPCRMMAPILEDVAQQMGDRAKIVKLNVDEAPQTAGRFGIQSIPTLAVFKDGEAIGAVMGVQPAKKLVDLLELALNNKLEPVS